MTNQRMFRFDVATTHSTSHERRWPRLIVYPLRSWNFLNGFSALAATAVLRIETKHCLLLLCVDKTFSAQKASYKRRNAFWPNVNGFTG